MIYEGKKTELDNLVINDCGVFIIEVKNYSGIITGTEADYEWKKYKITNAGNIYEKSVRNPVPQVRRQIYILANHLRHHGVNVWVRGYAILLHNNSPVRSDLILTCLEEVDRAVHTTDRKKPDTDTIVKIIRLLTETELF